MTLKIGKVALAVPLAWAALSLCHSSASQAAKPGAVVPLPPVAEQVSPGVVRLTLEEAKQRALASSPDMALATMNTQEKQHALRAVHADYLPKILGNITALHYDQPLGTVVTVRNAVSVPVNIVQQDQTIGSIMAVQPITDLLKVRGLSRVTAADGRIAQADVEKARRAILSGTEQLYVGLWAGQKIRAGTAAAAASTAPFAENGPLDLRAAYLEAVQGTQQADSQIGDLQEQMNSLLSFPLQTQLVLAELPPLNSPVAGADDTVALALSQSPEICQATETIEKADAALRIAKSDYIPNVMALGGYLNNNGIPAIQNNIGYVGVNASYTLFDAGKRRHLIHKSETDLAMAHAALRKSREEVALKAQKAYRTFDQAGQAVVTARKMAALRKEIAAQKLPPQDAMIAAKASLNAEVDLIKAEVAHRIAYAELASIVGQPGLSDTCAPVAENARAGTTAQRR